MEFRNKIHIRYRAALFAEEAHRGQVDKLGVPYIVHLLRVAARVPGNFEAVALLHDVIEDTDVTPIDLHKEGFDDSIVIPVVALTRRDEETYAAYIERVAQGEAAVHTVKLADIRDHLNNNAERLPRDLRERYEKALTVFSDYRWDTK